MAPDPNGPTRLQALWAAPKSGLAAYGRRTQRLRTELRELAVEYPERTRRATGLRFDETGADHALPLDDRSAP